MIDDDEDSECDALTKQIEETLEDAHLKINLLYDEQKQKNGHLKEMNDYI